MKIKFTTPVQIANIDGSRQNLKPGTYDLDEQVLNHWFIRGLISSGYAVILDKPKSVVKPTAPGVVKKIVTPKDPLPEENPAEALSETILENVEIEEKPKKASRRRRSG